MNRQKLLYNHILPFLYKTNSPLTEWVNRLSVPFMNQSMNDLLKEENDCPICLSPFKENDLIKVLPCNHFFHKNCLDLWFIKEGVCPICRQSLASTTSMTTQTTNVKSELAAAIRTLSALY